jgi:hypothetical protein
VKRCRDCRHNHISWLSPIAGRYDTCTAPQNPSKVNYVIGKLEAEVTDCEVLRKFEHFCAPEGKWFAPKHPPITPIPPYIIPAKVRLI